MIGVDELAFENKMVLAVVQALIGAVPEYLLAVTMESDVGDQTLDLYFAARSVTDELRVLVGEVADDIQALTAGEVLVRTSLWEGPSWTDDWPGLAKRPVFAAHVARN